MHTLQYRKAYNVNFLMGISFLKKDLFCFSQRGTDTVALNAIYVWNIPDTKESYNITSDWKSDCWKMHHVAEFIWTRIVSLHVPNKTATFGVAAKTVLHMKSKCTTNLGFFSFHVWQNYLTLIFKKGILIIWYYNIDKLFS